MRKIFVDTETTGLSAAHGHRIIEIGAIEVDGKITKKKSFHCYLNPEKLIDTFATEIHGITNEFVADKAKFKNIMWDFIDFIKGAELIMHNARFDQSFIDNELSLAGFDQKLDELCTITDTLKIARELHPGENNSLDGLCSRYSVNELDRSFHGALLDAEILSQVYSKIFKKNYLIPEVQQ
jgi:DNA polymerase-3 subunit epsilon